MSSNSDNFRRLKISIVLYGNGQTDSKAVESLSSGELVKFRAWFEEFEASRFDRKIERDAKRGKFDKLAEEAVHEDRGLMQLEPSRRKADISALFDLGASETPTDIAHGKDKMIGNAAWDNYVRETKRKPRRPADKRRTR